MFKSIELGLKASREEYSHQLPNLRADLLEAQTALRGTRIPVIVLVSGVEGAGKAEVVNSLNEWLDPRGVETNAFWPMSDEERARPHFWRFWRTLPARGRIGIFFGSWYTNPILQRVSGELKPQAFETELQRIAAFERLQVEDGALIVKFWYHLSKKAQGKRLKKLEDDPNTRWRVTPADWKFHRKYDDFAEVCEHTIRATDTGAAPWHLIDAENRRHRNLETGRILLAALKQRIEKEHQNKPAAPAPAKTVTEVKKAPEPVTRSTENTILDKVDLKSTLTDKEYKEKLRKYQARLNALSWAARDKGVASVMVFEGWDAAGKGGAIRRVTTAIDSKLTRVISIAAPTDEERAHHYLWRFWRHIPPAGLVAIFDRSWYGRVLVERVEGFASVDEWMRSYQEINDFEDQLAAHGIVVTKFWVHISPEEQLRRFKEREKTLYKRHKITQEDWRNRQKWDPYKLAVNEMAARTSTEAAPWVLVPGNDKKFARVEIVRTLCKRLEAAL